MIPGMETEVPAIYGEREAGRSNKVRQQIEMLKENVAESTFELADLLAEARENQYHNEWGYENFGEYASKSLGWSERQCYYLIRIVTGAKALGIERSELKPVAITKLKEIFRLDLGKHVEHIKRLVGLAKTATLEEIRAEVQAIIGEDGGEEMTWRNFRVTRTQAAAIDDTFEKVRRLAGTVTDEQGNYIDISDGTALELMCADFSANPDEVLLQLLKTVEISDGGPEA